MGGALERRAPVGGDRQHGWLAALPPVESLERALFTVLAIGMASLTVAILMGLLFVTDLFAQHLVHKVTLEYIASVTSDELSRVVDTRWTPPVTASGMPE